MSIKKIIKNIEGQIYDCIKGGEDLDSASWQLEEGVLLSVNEARAIIAALQQAIEADAPKTCPGCGLSWSGEPEYCHGCARELTQPLHNDSGTKTDITGMRENT